MSQPTPSLIRFEHEVEANRHENACKELLLILDQIDTNFGKLYGIECDFPLQLKDSNLFDEQYIHFCTRAAVAIGKLFSDPELHISDTGTLHFLTMQRWINLIFASSPYGNADHILARYNINPDPDSLWDEMKLDNNIFTLRKFCILYLPESNININLDFLWHSNPELAASLAFALQSPRFIGTPTAFGKRASLLQWFPEKLAQIDTLDNLPSGISHDVYMHCSYDTAANKHDVKRSLNEVIRRHILKSGWQDRDVSQISTTNGKPVMMVLLEHFHSAHSIYRTHSTSMIAAREHFHTIGIGNDSVDEAGRAVFDEFIELSKDSVIQTLSKLRQIAEQYRPAVFYMPSIGMDLKTIFASNTRIAPIQAIALGHPATTHSPFIDYVVVEDDYVGSESCFSETLLRLPKDALPYVASALAPQSVEYRMRENPEVVQIGIASTTMKLNPHFLEACRAIRDRAKVKVHFHFALGQSSGITHPYIARFIKSYLGNDATAHPQSPYSEYLRILHQCDMMINPFPFGNTNGIIDMVTLGLVGVCKTGAEVHEHIDEGLFKRLGLPEWLIADTVDEYIDCAVRLAENHEERLALRRHIIENNGLNTLFSGDATPLGRIFLEKTRSLQHSDDKPTAPPEKNTPKTTNRTRTKSAAPTKTAEKTETQSANKPRTRKPAAKNPK